MASKRRIRKNECGEKVKYTETERAKANSHAFALSKKRNKKFWVYKCKWCHYLHVGKPSKKQLDVVKQRQGL